MFAKIAAIKTTTTVPNVLRTGSPPVSRKCGDALAVRCVMAIFRWYYFQVSSVHLNYPTFLDKRQHRWYCRIPSSLNLSSLDPIKHDFTLEVGSEYLESHSGNITQYRV